MDLTRKEDQYVFDLYRNDYDHFFKKLANVIVPAKALGSLTSKKQRKKTVQGVTNTTRQISRVATAAPRALGSLVRTGGLKGYSIAGKGSLKRDVKDFGVGGGIIGGAVVATPALAAASSKPLVFKKPSLGNVNLDTVGNVAGKVLDATSKAKQISDQIKDATTKQATINPIQMDSPKNFLDNPMNIGILVLASIALLSLIFKKK